MRNKRITISLIYLITLIILYAIPTMNYRHVKNDISIQFDRIVELSINDKVLNEEFYVYLESLKNARTVSYDSSYFSQMGLGENEADQIKILYNDGSSDCIYTGMTREKGTRIYLRFKDSDTIFEVNGEIGEILNEKPDSTREYTLLESVQVTSVIAVRIESREKNMVFILNEENEWTDQISGKELNKLEIQNLIFKIINLRVSDRNEADSFFNPSATVQIETKEGQVFNLQFDTNEESHIFIRKNNKKNYKVIKDKINFLNFNFSDRE